VASVSVHAQSPAFQRGDLVRVKAADGHPTTTLVLTVAAPRDRIRLADSTVYVNDVAVSAFSPDFLARVARDKAPQLVPDGHYFVMAEQRSTQDISEYWGQHSEQRLERAR
jgi:hypothetical protein